MILSGSPLPAEVLAKEGRPGGTSFTSPYQPERQNANRGKNRAKTGQLSLGEPANKCEWFFAKRTHLGPAGPQSAVVTIPMPSVRVNAFPPPRLRVSVANHSTLATFATFAAFARHLYSVMSPPRARRDPVTKGDKR